MSKKPKFQRTATPAGVALFPNLNTPDIYKGDAKFKCKLVMDPNDPTVKGWMEKVAAASSKAFDEFKAKAKAKDRGKMSLFTPWEDQYDENDEPTGKIIVKASCKGDYPPALFDQFNQPTDSEIWSGSTLQMSCAMIPFHMASTGASGVSLRLNAVKIINLRGPGSGFDAESYGFDAETDAVHQDVRSGDDGDDDGGDF